MRIVGEKADIGLCHVYNPTNVSLHDKVRRKWHLKKIVLMYYRYYVNSSD